MSAHDAVNAGVDADHHPAHRFATDTRPNTRSPLTSTSFPPPTRSAASPVYKV